MHFHTGTHTHTSFKHAPTKTLVLIIQISPIRRLNYKIYTYITRWARQATKAKYEAGLSEFPHAFVGCVRSDAAIIVSHLAWLDKMPLMSFGATLSEFAGENMNTHTHTHTHAHCFMVIDVLRGGRDRQSSIPGLLANESGECTNCANGMCVCKLCRGIVAETDAPLCLGSS
jgi:hypothetical protein